MVDFTRPDAVVANVHAAVQAGVPCVVGTSGAIRGSGGGARRPVSVFFAPNFAIGAVLMMRFAEEAARICPPRDRRAPPRDKARRALGHGQGTAERLPGEAAIHSVRLPGLVAHQEVLLGGQGQLLTIRPMRSRARPTSRACCSRSSGSPRCRPA